MLSSRKEAQAGKVAKTLKSFLDTEMLYWPSFVPLFCWDIVTVSPTLTPLSFTKLSHCPVITGLGDPLERQDSLKVHSFPRVSIAWNSISLPPSWFGKRCRKLAGTLSLSSTSVRDKLFEMTLLDGSLTDGSLTDGSAVVSERE